MNVDLPPIQPESVRIYGLYQKQYLAFVAEHQLEAYLPTTARDFMIAIQPKSTYQQLENRYNALRRFFLEKGLSLRETTEYWDTHVRLLEELLPSKKHTQPIYITDQEYRGFIYSMPETRFGAHDRAIATTVYNTGASDYSMREFEKRHFNIVPLQGAEIELQTPYGPRLVRVPFHEDPRLCCVLSLKYWRSKTVGPYMFGTLRREEHRSSNQTHFLRDVMTRNLPLSGITRHMTISALKFGYIACAIRRGVDDETIMRQMGFKDIISAERWRRRIIAEDTPSIFDFMEDEAKAPWDYA